MFTNYERLNAYLERLRNEIYSEPESELHNELAQKAIELFVKPVKKDIRKVLDVGCGQGIALKRFYDLDFDAVGITLGREDFKACIAKGHDVRIMDQSFLDFEKDIFDLVWVRHCIEHSVMPLITLFEFNRVLKKGKYLYLEMPQAEGIHVNNPNHYSLLGPKGWKHLLSKSSFEIIKDGRFNFNLIDGTPDEYMVFWNRKIGDISI
jgi:SAM-dependent methyltransferase